MALITTKEAAERLGISKARILQLIRAGRLKAHKFGRDLQIREGDLAEVADRKPGRPKQQKKSIAA